MVAKAWGGAPDSLGNDPSDGPQRGLHPSLLEARVFLLDGVREFEGNDWETFLVL